MLGYTQLCARLNGLQSEDGKLLSHKQLLKQLISEREEDDGAQCVWHLGTWVELQGRTQCSFCQLVATAILSSSGSQPIDAEQDVQVLILPAEQSFRLSFPSRLGTRLAFIAERRSQAAGPDTARPVRGKTVEIPRILRWLEVCDTAHERCSLKHVDICPPRTSASQGLLALSAAGRGLPGSDNRGSHIGSDIEERITHNFRVLDLELGCIKSAILEDTRYVALSYVWGQLPMFKLSRKNLAFLSGKGSLEHVRSELPNTINDAIDLVLALGERYLWVDALCLVQDDGSDVSLGVEQMNTIYSQSYFTIVAASGSDASAGLPGLPRSPRDVTQVMAEVGNGLKLAVLHSIDWHLSRSVYNQRGWTLQELVLPQRTLIFIDGQVFFRCQEANWSEDSWSDSQVRWLDDDDSNISRLPDSNDGLLPSLWAYQKLCEEYSRRSLLHDGDVLRAAAGILRPLAAAMPTFMIEGLPGYHLDMLLLFISNNGRMRRRKEFASFSWAGWEGSIMWPRENYYRYRENMQRAWHPANIINWFREKPYINWTSIDSNGHCEELTSYCGGSKSWFWSLMRKYCHVPGLEDYKDPRHQPNPRAYYSYGSTAHSSIPNWEGLQDNSFPDESNEANENASTEEDLAIEQDTILEGMSVSNIRAASWFRVNRGLSKKSPNSAIPIRKVPHYKLRNVRDRRPDPRLREEEKHYRFRPSRNSGSNESLYDERTIDHRVIIGNKYILNAATCEPLNRADRVESRVPNFPPYTVLSFRAISIHVVLGDINHAIPVLPRIESPRDPARSPFDRIPGIPLLSCPGGGLVGSLHPDNLGLLPESGSPIECVVVSRSQTPTVGSALFKLGRSNDDLESRAADSKPWDLFWVIYCVWIDGIAERRGIGQVLVSVLGGRAEPRAEVKDVLLG